MEGHSLLIRPTGGASYDTHDRPEDGESIAERIGGSFQLIPGFDTYQGRRCLAYCHEEGKLLRLPYNPEAQRLWHAASPNAMFDVLVGNVLIIWGDEQFMGEQ